MTIQEEIIIKDLEPVIPFTRAKDIIMQNPDRIIALDCPCRSSRADPCYPLDVCLIIGDPFVSFILEHQPEKSRLISSLEAMDILKAEHERGHVHHTRFLKMLCSIGFMQSATAVPAAVEHFKPIEMELLC